MPDFDSFERIFKSVMAADLTSEEGALVISIEQVSHSQTTFWPRAHLIGKNLSPKAPFHFWLFLGLRFLLHRDIQFVFLP
jgi:hypothetical protein